MIVIEVFEHWHQPRGPPETAATNRENARRFNVAGRDERNRSLGKAGEERVFHHERAHLAASGRRDLAAKVRWVSQEDGNSAGYDIASFAPDGLPRLIEVKMTNGWERTPFYISRNELEVAEARRHEWSLMRLFDFSRDVRAFELRPPLEAHVSLMPPSFRPPSIDDRHGMAVVIAGPGVVRALPWQQP